MIGLVDGNNFYVSCERVFDRRLEGRPVAVLSNNDGCCVSMSPEFKARGIARGTPYFRLRGREAAEGARDGLVFLSSNYELYGDMSRRMVEILRQESVAAEQYSIDEAFIRPPSTAVGDLAGYGGRLRRKLLRWIGIPCGIGFAKTKTLAKIANHVGKKLPGGVFVMPDDPSDLLAGLPVGEVWGVGGRLAAKLRAERILTAAALRDADDGTIRAVGGVVLLRTAMELRGVDAVQERDYGSDPDSVSCSRTFGSPVRTLDALSEALASFAAQAAEKLRRHRMLAAGCNVYAQYGSALAPVCTARTVVFGCPTDATNEMLSSISREISAIYLQGEDCRKCGVVFFGLEPAEALRQADLFADCRAPERSALYAAIDRLNVRYGKGSLAAAAEGLRSRRPSWAMRRDKLSGVSTTDWTKLPMVRA